MHAVRAALRGSEAARRCERWIAESRERVFDEPRQALAAACRATEEAESLAPADGEPAAVSDLRTEAWAYRGNAERVVSDFDAAETSFRTAWRHLAAGSGAPLLRARLCDLEASLASARGNHELALERIDEAVGLCRAEGDSLLLGYSRVKQAFFLDGAGDPAAALAALREGLAHLDPHSDLRTWVAAVHNLARLLNLLGYTIAARSLLRDLRPLHERLGDRVNLLRLEWLEAQIDQGLGDAARAERKLGWVRQGFLDQEMAYDAALVSLDLAALYAEQKRVFDLRDLALEMFPVFQSRRIHREALAALILFREAISAGRADAALIAEVRDFLLRARTDHRLRFRA